MRTKIRECRGDPSYKFYQSNHLFQNLDNFEKTKIFDRKKNKSQNGKQYQTNDFFSKKFFLINWGVEEEHVGK